MIGSRLFIDSGVWISYFLKTSEESRRIIDSTENKLFTSVLSLHEVNRTLGRKGLSRTEMSEATRIIMDTSTLTLVDEQTALNSVDHCLHRKLYTVDAIIYESSLQNGCTLVTGDTDFKGLKDVKIIE